MIGIINYGMGNLASVKNALDFINLESIFIDKPSDFSKADKLILPGVGAFGQAMENLKKLDLCDQIQLDVLENKKPLLGICLGMQLLFTQSLEHGKHKGLNLIKGEVLPFKGKIENLAVPHIGWNNVEINGSNSLISKSEEHDKVYYFVHSFYCHLNNETEASGITEYGIHFHSMLEKDNIFGCQFHPEKSQKAGLAILEKFGNL